MPGLMVYKNGEQIALRATVIDTKDLGNIVVDIGGKHYAMNQRHLDAADFRPAGARPLTPEEQDRKALYERELARLKALAVKIDPKRVLAATLAAMNEDAKAKAKGKAKAKA